MNKLLGTLIAIVAIFSLGLAPTFVSAQGVEEINGPSDTTAESTPLPSTGGTEVAAPDTGIAPSNHVVRNSAVFIGGSLLGAGIGLGIVTLRKKKLEQ